MSKLGEMLSDPAFEKFAISLGEDLPNKNPQYVNVIQHIWIMLHQIFMEDLELPQK
jgi:hypothetical protein